MPKKEKTGLVISNKMEKTVVVAVNDYEPHPQYKKIMTETKHYVSSDEKNECNEDDIVRIVESKPVRKTKHWTVRD